MSPHQNMHVTTRQVEYSACLLFYMPLLCLKLPCAAFLWFRRYFFFISHYSGNAANLEGVTRLSCLVIQRQSPPTPQNKNTKIALPKRPCRTHKINNFTWLFGSASPPVIAQHEITHLPILHALKKKVTGTTLYSGNNHTPKKHKSKENLLFICCLRPPQTTRSRRKSSKGNEPKPA